MLKRICPSRLALFLGAWLLSACERPAAQRGTDTPAAMTARDTTTARDTATRATKDTIPRDELPGDTVTTLVEDSAATEPRLERVGSGFVLWMPTEMHDALQAHAPGFEALRRRDYGWSIRQYLREKELSIPLFAVLGDLDGDGRKDAVVHGVRDSNLVVLAVLNDPSGARAVDIQEEHDFAAQNRRLGTYLVHQRPGTIRSGWEQKPLQLRNDAFAIVYFEKAATLHYYRGGQFLKYTTAD
jgi:hypothetical protein